MQCSDRLELSRAKTFLLSSSRSTPAQLQQVQTSAAPLDHSPARSNEAAARQTGGRRPTLSPAAAKPSRQLVLDAVAARPPSVSVTREPASMAQAPVSLAQSLPGRTASGPPTNCWTTRPRRPNSHETVEALYLVPFVLLNIVVYVFNVCGGSGSWGTGVSRRTTKGCLGDDATRAGSTRVVLRRRLGFVRCAGGLRNRFNSTRTTDAAPNISSVAAHRAEAVDGSMMGCSCYSTASVVGRDTGSVDWIRSTRRSGRER